MVALVAPTTPTQASQHQPAGEKVNGGALVCEALLAQGVTTLFGYPGGAALPFYRELARYPALRHVLVRHEQNAAHAADGYARATGKVGVCVATSGPGATNLLTGLATAFMDCVPAQWRALCWAPVMSGARPGELFAMHRDYPTGDHTTKALQTLAELMQPRPACRDPAVSGCCTAAA